MLSMLAAAMAVFAVALVRPYAGWSIGAARGGAHTPCGNGARAKQAIPATIPARTANPTGTPRPLPGVSRGLT